MLGGIVEGIGNSLRRLREGTADLMGNAKQLGSLKCVSIDPYPVCGWMDATWLARFSGAFDQSTQPHTQMTTPTGSAGTRGRG